MLVRLAYEDAGCDVFRESVRARQRVWVDTRVKHFLAFGTNARMVCISSNVFVDCQTDHLTKSDPL